MMRTSLWYLPGALFLDVGLISVLSGSQREDSTKTGIPKLENDIRGPAALIKEKTSI